MRGGEEGSGPVSTVFGVAIFLGFLLLATQALVHLYATSTVRAAAFDGARRAAAGTASVTAGARDLTGCESRVRDLLGAYGRRGDVAVRCDLVGDAVRVAVDGPTPADLLAGFGERVGSGGISHASVVRLEEFR